MKPSNKEKKAPKKRQKVTADQFLMCVQLYSLMIDAAKHNSKQGGKVNFKIEGILRETMDLLQARNKEVDVQGVFHDWYYLLEWKSLEELKMGERMVEELQSFDIEIPELLENCLREIKMRTRLVNEYATVKHQWTDEKITIRKEEIEGGLLAYSYDKESRKQHLKELFSEAVKEIKKIKEEARAKFGYYIDGFFITGKFVATETDLNNFFWHGEMYAGGYTSFQNLALLLIKFVDQHNETALLKSLINENIDKRKGYITNGGEDYIKPELLPELEKMERNLQPEIAEWNKIKVAAWVQLLMDKGYFELEYKKKNNRKNCAGFAKARYGLDVYTQFGSKDREDRKTHKLQLSKHFKKSTSTY